MELDYGKINGWPALKMKVVRAYSKRAGDEDVTVEGSVFSESAPSETPAAEEMQSSTSSSATSSSSDSDGSDSDSDSESDSSKSASGNSS